MEDGRRIIIGHANTWHDPAIAVDASGKLFAEATERPMQCKRGMESSRLWYSWRSLRDFLEETEGLPVEDQPVTAVSSWRGETPSRLLDRPQQSPIAALLAGSVLLEPIAHNQLLWTLRGHPPRIFAPPNEPRLGVRGPAGTTGHPRGMLHQLAHAANAVYTSPFEDCVVMVLDGSGEGTATSFFLFRDGDFELLHQDPPVFSMGLLYAAVTQFAGFD
ncbi:MAG: carbamoyltransferase N-terminal domain-containing protein, partial [Acidobacteriota bacterium]